GGLPLSYVSGSRPAPVRPPERARVQEAARPLEVPAVPAPAVARPGPLPLLSITMDPADFEAVQLNPQGRGKEWERPGLIEVFDREGKRLAATRFGMRLHGGAGRQGGLSWKKSYLACFRKRHGQGRLEAPV